ncbi:MAG: UDP-N-acetylglucosamine 2-epimerase (non-hydrolyzing), partial [Calditerrivibrio sp.]|nr:UDP-N-acetylglucosamine 2-epimerase (non-hydrolyzing) [Calditerrivibrio sp.]
MRKKILLVFGTRPEAIKCAPLFWELKKHSDLFNTKVCITAQHRQMLDQVLDFFQITPDYDLNLMKNNQTLFDITSDCLKKLEGVLDDFVPELVIVQGDTTSAFVAALAAFYKKVKVAHLEAGLRSQNKYSPFPEEINRVLVGHLADFHFAPTKKAKQNLYKEGIRNNVYVVGNTVIDALFMGVNRIESDVALKGEIDRFFEKVIKDQKSKILLVTGHRRESFGEGFENICNALRELAFRYREIEIVYPVHLNPNVKEPVNRILKDIENIHLIDPLEYPYLLWLMKKSYLVLTDSGGIQEEAPSLGKPVLVMRDVTERVEGIEAGTSMLVGTGVKSIVEHVSLLLNNEEVYRKMSQATNPYGDGRASERVVKRLG